jgi:DNA polymerase III epsilon subunit-like protein
MREKKLAFIDLETTGMDPLKHEIIEIGCLLAKLDDKGQYVELESFELKVKPEHIETAEQEALRVNGYDEDHIFRSPSTRDAAFAEFDQKQADKFYLKALKRIII